MVDHAPTLRYQRGLGLSKGLRSLRTLMAQRRLRVVSWQGDPYIALVGPTRNDLSPTSSDIEYCLKALARKDVFDAITPALSRFEAEPFYQAGFTLRERLHLLTLDLLDNLDVDRPLGLDGVSMGSGRPWHKADVLAVDERAFQSVWRFDGLALKEALTATPSRRYRVATVNGKIVGYAITGLAGRRGYLQRLAVEPSMQGRGIGTALIADSCRWLKTGRATLSFVNTQESNEVALGLYEHLGFVRQNEGLVVLKWQASPLPSGSK